MRPNARNQDTNPGSCTFPTHADATEDTMTIEFQPWPKIARLNRNCTITEKIDGTNAAVGIMIDYCEVEGVACSHYGAATASLTRDEHSNWIVYAQSRKKIITPEQDNAGFARYVRDNATELVSALGEGLHFGEWWGSGIQRGYGLLKGEKRFSLFNTPRYSKFDLSGVPNLGTVPVLFEGLFNTHTVQHQLEILRVGGSQAAPGYMNPEGIIVFHEAAQVPFKVTLVGDEKPKGSSE